MVLHADEERVVCHFHNFNQATVWVYAACDHTARFKLFQVIVVELKAMAVPLANQCFSVYAMSQRAFLYFAWIRTEPHRATHHLYFLLLFHHVDDGI